MATLAFNFHPGIQFLRGKKCEKRKLYFHYVNAEVGFQLKNIASFIFYPAYHGCFYSPCKAYGKVYQDCFINVRLRLWLKIQGILTACCFCIKHSEVRMCFKVCDALMYLMIYRLV